MIYNNYRITDELVKTNIEIFKYYNFNQYHEFLA